MNKRIALLTALLLATVLVAGCVENTQAKQEKQQKDLEESTNVDTSNTQVGSSFWSEMKMTESIQQDHIKREPPEPMDDSLERQNLQRRYETLNQQNKQFYVYLISHGQILGYFTALGKVSSVNSKLTQPEQIVPCPTGDQGGHDNGNFNNRDGGCVVSSPQLDGSYGTNGDAVFFFTADGRYVEVNTDYIVSDEPINLHQPVQFTADVDQGEGQ